ncbi:MAG: hypothetical protein RL367_1740 [Pseudomonadota bacterium]
MDVDDPDRQIALAYAGHNREKLRFLFMLDETLGRIVATVREPMIAQMKLAWWRESLELALTNVKKGEPLLEMAHSLKMGPELVAMVNGWEAALAELPLSDDVLLRFAQGRGATLFAAAIGFYGRESGLISDAAGRSWALVDFAFRCSDDQTRNRALALARNHDRPVGLPLPLGIMTALVQSDIRRGPERRWRPGSPMRMLRALGWFVFKR